MQPKLACSRKKKKKKQIIKENQVELKNIQTKIGTWEKKKRKGEQTY